MFEVNDFVGLFRALFIDNAMINAPCELILYWPGAAQNMVAEVGSLEVSIPACY